MTDHATASQGSRIGHFFWHVQRLLLHSRTFFLSILGAVTAALPLLANYVPELQQLATTLGAPAWVQPAIMIGAPLLAAVFRAQDHVDGSNPA